MASVTFPKELGGNGQTYTDDADPNTGLDGLGYTVRFIPCLKQAVVMGQSAASSAQAAASYVQQCQTLREEVAADRTAVASARQHIDKQKTAVDKASAAAAQSAASVSADKIVHAPGSKLPNEAGEAYQRDVVGGTGALLARGAFGFGAFGSGSDDGSNYIDASRPLGAQANGLRAISSSSYPPDWPENLTAPWSSVLLNKRSETTGVGLIHSISNDIHAFRVSGGLMGDITKLLSEKNAVGAIDLINGIPSGGLFERDSNDDGEWIKFFDGTMICFNFGFERVVSAANTDSLPNGWVRYGLGSGNQIFFPKPFVESPVMSFLNRNPQAGSRYLYGVQIDVGVTISGTEARPQIIFPHGPQTNTPVFLAYMAIGRWY